MDQAAPQRASSSYVPWLCVQFGIWSLIDGELWLGTLFLRMMFPSAVHLRRLTRKTAPRGSDGQGSSPISDQRAITRGRQGQLGDASDTGSGSGASGERAVEGSPEMATRLRFCHPLGTRLAPAVRT